MLHWIVYFILVSIVFVNLGTINVLGFTLNQIVIFFGIFLGLIYKFFNKASVYHVGSIDFCLVIFASYLWVSNFIVSSNPEWGIRVCLDFLRSLACYFIVVFLVDDSKKIRFLVLTYIFTSTAMIFTANYFETINTGLEFVTDARQGLTGLADSYIIYALYALMSVPLAYSVVKNTKKPYKPIFFLIIGLLSVATLFSGSRGAVIAFVVTIIFMIIIEMRGNKRAVMPGVTILTVLSLSLIILFWIKGGGSIFDTLVGGQNQRLDPSMAGRMVFQKEALYQFIDHPIFGIGIDAFRHQIFKHVPHNQWLQILVELGLVGFIVAAITTYFIFRSLYFSRKLAGYIGDFKMVNTINGLMVSLFMFLFWGLYENIGYITAQKVFFMLIGLAVSINTYLVKNFNIARSGIYGKPTYLLSGNAFK